MEDLQVIIAGFLCTIGSITIIGLIVFGLINMFDGLRFNSIRKDYCMTKFDNKLEIKNCQIKPVYKFMTEYLK